MSARAHACAALFALAAGLFGASARAEDTDRAYRSVLILARAMAYDRALLTRRPDGVVVGVIYDPNLQESRTEATETLDVFSTMPNANIGGKPLSAVGVPLDELAGQADHLSALYLCGGLEPHLPEILATSRDRDRLTLTTRPGWVEQGVSVGVRWADGRPLIQVNLPASKQEAAAFASDLLKLADVIR